MRRSRLRAAPCDLILAEAQSALGLLTSAGPEFLCLGAHVCSEWALCYQITSLWSLMTSQWHTRVDHTSIIKQLFAQVTSRSSRQHHSAIAGTASSNAEFSLGYPNCGSVLTGARLFHAGGVQQKQVTSTTLVCITLLSTDRLCSRILLAKAPL